MDFPNDADKNNLTMETDKDSLMEELSAEGLCKSLSTISLESLNHKLNQMTPPITPKIKDTHILDLNGTTNDEEESSSKKDTDDNNASSQGNVLERLEEYKAISKEYKSFIFEVSLDIIDAFLNTNSKYFTTIGKQNIKFSY